MTEFRLPIRVYIEDTDAQGIVYYVNYLKYMERARSEWLRSYGFNRPAFGGEGQIYVVHSLTTNYRKPAKLDDQIVVTARTTDYGRAYFVVEQKVFRDDELLCEGSIKVACVNQASGRPAAMPKEMIERIFIHSGE
ncbi:tol-pal system-associated acyl-CoA thioesterase [Gammaproteobacteria bacterium 50_400_T64]|nr:tol-pal system-associated acyl-CoA thioesterase [Gammaproteobacteria bacterium 50_400_T64]